MKCGLSSQGDPFQPQSLSQSRTLLISFEFLCLGRSHSYLRTHIHLLQSPQLSYDTSSRSFCALRPSLLQPLPVNCSEHHQGWRCHAERLERTGSVCSESNDPSLLFWNQPKERWVVARSRVVGNCSAPWDPNARRPDLSRKTLTPVGVIRGQMGFMIRTSNPHQLLGSGGQVPTGSAS